jgi:hypothetical protein
MSLLDGIRAAGRLDAILPLGDNAYPDGSLIDYQSSFAATWGRPDLLAIERPAPGNHDYATNKRADGYFDYFDGVGAEDGRAGPRDRGYYSYDLGSWHLVALNSSDGCNAVSCAEGSPQQQWLAADLAAHPRACTLAYWHIPRYQAGATWGDMAAAAPLWNTLFDAGVDVVLVGHEHNFQQLVPLGRDGQPDPARGIRTFVVGTGGADREDSKIAPAYASIVEADALGEHGVLQLDLGAADYGWRFIPVAGAPPAPGTTGHASCH